MQVVDATNIIAFAISKVGTWKKNLSFCNLRLLDKVCAKGLTEVVYLSLTVAFPN